MQNRVTRALLLIGILGTSILLAVLFLSGEDPDHEPGESAGGTEKATAAARDSATTDEKTQGERKELTTARDSQTPRDPTAKNRDGQSDTGEEIVIHIMIGPTKKPAPRIEVAVMSRPFEWASMTDDDREFVNQRDAIEVYSKFGTVHRTDNEGRLRLRIDKSLFLVCEHGELYGRLTIQREKLAVGAAPVLLLVPDQAIHVRVVDAATEGVAGVPILLRPIWDAPEQAPHHRSNPGSRLATTDASGHANVRHLQDWLSRFSGIGLPDRARVEPGIPGWAGAATEFSVDRMPPDVILIRMPATGSITLRLMDGDDRPVGSYEDLALRRSAAVTDSQKVPPQQSWKGEPAGPGAAHFRHVGLGLELRATGWVGKEAEPVTFFGPTRAGQEVEQIVRAPTAALELAGRLLDANRQPTGRLRARLHYEFGTEAGSWLFQTDDDGRFAFEFDEDRVGQSFSRLAVQKFVRSELVAELATVTFPHPLKAGRNDLGDVVLLTSPTLVEGTVTTDGSKPTVPIDIGLEFLHDDGWRRERTATVVVKPTGEFTVRGIARSGRYRLVPGSPDCLPAEPVAVNIGSTGVRLDLRRGGTLQIAVILAEPLLAKNLAFELRPDVPTEATRKALSWRGRKPGGEFKPARDDKPPVFVWQGLPPGEYELGLLTFGGQRTFATIDLVTIQPGETTRLAPIDLREKLRPILLHILDADGKPFDVFRAIAWTGTAGEMVASPVIGGFVTILVAGPVDLWVAGQGHVVQRLAAVDADRRVQLERIPETDVVLPAVTMPPGRRLELRARSAADHTAALSVRVRSETHIVGNYIGPQAATWELGVSRTVRIPRYAAGTRLSAVAKREDGEERSVRITPSELQATSRKKRVQLEIDGPSLQDAIRSLSR